MKYEFHAGDYIECHNGSIGYLTDGKTWYSGTLGQDVICLQGNTTVDVSCGFTPFTITIPFSDVSKYFNRIGQYDFTKPEQLEGIEHIKVADNDIRCNTPIGDSLLILKNKINEFHKK